MATKLGLAHTNPTSYHPSKVATNGAAVKQSRESLPKVQALPNTASVEEVVEALKVRYQVPSKNEAMLNVLTLGSWRGGNKECCRL